MTARSDPAAAATPPVRTPTVASIPPRWFVRTAWAVHRAIYRLTGHRRGLGHPRPADGRFGYLLLTTTGRRSGKQREAVLGYIEDGPNLATIAMNGWAEAQPAWWLNLQAQPATTIQLKGSVRRVRARARAAEGEERQRLWATMSTYQGWGKDLDAFARLRSGPSTVVVFEPR